MKLLLKSKLDDYINRKIYIPTFSNDYFLLKEAYYNPSIFGARIHLVIQCLAKEKLNYRDYIDFYVGLLDKIYLVNEVTIEL